MGLTSDDIDQLIQEVWAPTVELDLYPVGEEHGERPFVAVLEALGGWEGRVVVRSTDSFARGVASKMFGIPRPDVDDEDAADAVGELANVVGGNLKSLLGDDEVDLALPRTDVGDPSGSLVAQSVLQAGPGFEVTIQVLEGAAVRA